MDYMGDTCFLCPGVSVLFPRSKQGVQAGTMSTIVNQWILVAWSLYFPHFNKFHLLWLTPLSYVWGVPGMFAFAFIRSKWIILTVAVAINLFLLVLLTRARNQPGNASGVMIYLISWVWSFFAGVLSVSFLLMAWGAIRLQCGNNRRFQGALP